MTTTAPIAASVPRQVSARLRLLVLALLSMCLLAPAPVPRQSLELPFVTPSGAERRVSSLKGQVVLIEFLLTNCPHCARITPALNALGKELGPRGFQPLGIALDRGIGGPAVTNFVRSFNVTYPVGITSAEQVDRFLGRGRTERLQVPQIVVIDRRGVIRAQSGANGDPNLEREGYLRDLITRLLNEPA